MIIASYRETSACTGAFRSVIPLDPDRLFQRRPISHSDWSMNGIDLLRLSQRFRLFPEPIQAVEQLRM